jgi:hypothetical protein
MHAHVLLKNIGLPNEALSKENTETNVSTVHALVLSASQHNSDDWAKFGTTAC